jgi:hypothetical protein
MKEVIGEETSLATSLIVKKFFFVFPLAPTLFFIYRRNEKRKFKSILLIAFAGVMLLVFKNPLIEKRNAVGVIYLTVLFFLTANVFKSNFRSFLLLFGSMTILFPLSAILTHRSDSVFSGKEIVFDSSPIKEAFSSINYDAFSNMLASYHYLFTHGMSYGYQLLGGIFFFVPRALWESKPLSGGKEIGQYLMANFSMWFDNLACPFVAEGIMNFGFLSLLIFPFLLAYAVVFFERWLESNDILKKGIAVYFSFHLIFLLRGDFTNAFAYFIGTILAVYFLPKFINRIPHLKIRLF